MRISDWSSDVCSSDLVENWSFSSRDVRIHVSVGISYDADVHRAQELMLEAARACPRVLSTPEPLVWIRAFGERSVEFDIRVWISDPEAGIGNVQGDILLRVWELFKAHGRDRRRTRLNSSH